MKIIIATLVYVYVIARVEKVNFEVVDIGFLIKEHMRQLHVAVVSM